MRWARAVAPFLLGLLALAETAAAQALLDFVSFDGVDYIRFAEEPGRSGRICAGLT